MKTIIAGSRHITDMDIVISAINNSKFIITEVVCGCAKGVDELGKQWAKSNNIKIKYFKPAWEIFGPAAGPRRNQAMADYADALIAVWDGKSKGTVDMIRRAKKFNLKTYVFLLENQYS